MKGKGRIVTLFLCITILLTVATSGMTAARAVGPEVTRGQWISQLVDTFNMTVDDETTMPDNYFSDLTTESPYYDDILLAVEFGVIDLEAGEAFQPADPATREFAAHTLNYCLGFQLDDTDYTYSDSSATAYPDDVQVAVNREWLQLVNGAFNPDQAITSSEMETMLADAAAVLSQDEVTEGEGSFTVAEGVIVIPETVEVSIDMDDVLTITGYEGLLQTGDIFVVSFDGVPVAYEAGNVTKTDEAVIVQGLGTEAVDAITSAQFSGSTEIDLETFEPADTATYYVVNTEAGSDADVEVLTIAPQSLDYDHETKTLNITESISLNSATVGSITVVMNNIVFDRNIDWGFLSVDKAYCSVTSDLSVTTSVQFDLGAYTGIPSSIMIGGFNIGFAKLEVSAEFDLSGGLTATWTGDMEAGLSYTSGDGLRMVRGFNKDSCSLMAEADLRAGLRAYAELNLLVVEGSVWIEAGVAAGGSYAHYDDEALPESCVSFYRYLYAEAGYSARLLLKTYGGNETLYDLSNSPMRVYYHYEDGVLVDACTRDPDSYRYHTSVNSPYFNPGPGYAGGSYTLGGVTVATYTYEVLTDNSTGEEYAFITGYTGNPSVLAIPSELDGYPVRIIGNAAFYGKTSLRAVVIPNSVTRIEMNAFTNCINLSNVQLSSNLQHMEESVFRNCKALLEIEIPKSLQSADSWPGGPFSGSGLRRVTFEPGTTTIIANLFSGAAELEVVEFPSTVTRIGSHAFLNCKLLGEINFPESLTAIENDAFNGCTKLAEVWIPDDVVTIGDKAFMACTNLSSVRLSKTLSFLGGGAFGNCTNLTEIEIPRSLNETDGSPFSGSGLVEATFEAGTAEVVENLFSGAEYIEEVELLPTMTGIGPNAFSGCTSLSEIELPATIIEIGGSAFNGCTSLTSIVIPDSVVEIGMWAFQRCFSLSDVTLSKSLTTLGVGCFQNCTSLTEIEIPKSLEKTYMTGTIIGSSGVFYNSGLETVTFEDGTTTVVNNLFEDASSLKSVVFPESLMYIGNSAFCDCTSLTDIDLPDNLIGIRSDAFRGCTSLTEIILPGSVAEIGDNVFSGCSGLSDVILPNRLTSLGAYMFASCTSLQSINLPETLEGIGSGAFDGSALTHITIPSSCAAVGNNAFQNCTALTRVILEDGVENIGSNSFNGCTALTTVNLPDSLTEIGSYAFRDCDALTTIQVPNSVISLGNYVFANCNVLSDVTLGTGLTAIPQYAFYECPALVNISIPYRVTTISANAFANCTGLTEITIPQGVTNIATSAFSYKDRLTIYGVSGSYAEAFAQDNDFTFVAREVPATSVNLNHTELTVSRGSTAQLIITVEPTDFTDTVTWRTGNADVATVSDAGVVKAEGVGTTFIRVNVGDNLYVDCTVTVVQPMTSINLNRYSLQLEGAETYQLTATASPSNAYNQEVTWSSSDPATASVDETGLVTAHRKGTAIITAAAADGSGVSRSCTVTVTNNAYVVSSISGLESNHNYTNNCTDVWIYTVSDATYLAITFDLRTNIEDGFDFLHIYDESGALVGEYTGTELAGQTIRVEGTTVRIQLDTDSVGTAWGFKVINLETDGTMDPYAELETALDQALSLGTDQEKADMVQELDQELLTEALEAENSTIVEKLEKLETSMNITVDIVVDSGVALDKTQISVMGAKLNAASGETEMNVQISPAETSEEFLDTQYSSAISFTIALNGRSSLAVPMKFTIPIPAGIDLDGLVILQKVQGAGQSGLSALQDAQATVEYRDYTISYAGDTACASFVVTSLGEFTVAGVENGLRAAEVSEDAIGIEVYSTHEGARVLCAGYDADQKMTCVYVKALSAGELNIWEAISFAGVPADTETVKFMLLGSDLSPLTGALTQTVN